jgi:hypothetical protein
MNNSTFGSKSKLQRFWEGPPHDASTCDLSAYQLITTEKPDDPETTPNFKLILELTLYLKCNSSS